MCFIGIEVFDSFERAPKRVVSCCKLERSRFGAQVACSFGRQERRLSSRIVVILNCKRGEKRYGR